MKRSNWTWLIVGAIVVVVVLLGVSSYNNLVSAETNVESKLSTIDVDLQRRADLIPNLVNTVKGYAAHEQEVLRAIADARSRLVGAGSAQELADADAELSSALARLLVVVENYPTLKADAQFRQLMDELAGTENRIAVSRKDYNDAATAYNTRVRRFPSAIFAGLFGFERTPLFEAREGAGTVPEVTF